MSSKISDFFKFEQKVNKIEENSQKVRECQVVLKDIKHQFGRIDLNLFYEIPVDRQNNCGKEKNVCKYCGKKINSNMNEHVKKVHPTELNLFSCQFCSLKFLRKSKFDMHVKAKHPDGKVEQFECDFDGKIFKKKGVLSKHMEVHLPIIKCKICQKILKQGSINYHISYFHGTDKNFQCQICSKSFRSKNYLTAHVKSHNKEFECANCKCFFATFGQLNFHNKHYHTNPNKFECETCGKKFNLINNLKKHQKTHDKNRPKPYKCQQCDFATDCQNNFNKHQKFHERQNKKFAAMKNPIKCEKCSTFCSNKRALSYHKKQVHPKVQLQCDLCAHLIKTKTNLFTHINNHIRNFKK